MTMTCRYYFGFAISLLVFTVSNPVSACFFCQKSCSPPQKVFYNVQAPQVQQDQPAIADVRKGAAQAAKSVRTADQGSRAGIRTLELGPGEFTDPLLSVKWGKVRYTGALQGSHAETLQHEGAIIVHLTGARASSSKSRAEQHVVDLEIPVSFAGQLPAVPALNAYSVKVIGSVQGASGSQAHMTIEANDDSETWSYTPDGLEPLNQEVGVLAVKKPQPYVNRVQDMPAIRLKLKLTAQGGSPDADAAIEIQTIKIEPEFEW